MPDLQWHSSMAQQHGTAAAVVTENRDSRAPCLSAEQSSILQFPIRQLPNEKEAETQGRRQGRFSGISGFPMGFPVPFAVSGVPGFHAGFYQLSEFPCCISATTFPIPPVPWWKMGREPREVHSCVCVCVARTGTTTPPGGRW